MKNLVLNCQGLLPIISNFINYKQTNLKHFSYYSTCTQTQKSNIIVKSIYSSPSDSKFLECSILKNGNY